MVCCRAAAASFACLPSCLFACAALHTRTLSTCVRNLLACYLPCPQHCNSPARLNCAPATRLFARLFACMALQTLLGSVHPAVRLRHLSGAPACSPVCSACLPVCLHCPPGALKVCRFCSPVCLWLPSMPSCTLPTQVQAASFANEPSLPPKSPASDSPSGGAVHQAGSKGPGCRPSWTGRPQPGA